MSQDSIAVGEIRFLDNWVPALPFGTYQMEVNHSINEVSHEINTNFKASRGIIVEGPRFSLPAGSVHAKFPAAGASGDFHESLPFIVLNNGKLPWSRTLDGGDALPSPPAWLVLMLLEESELIYTPPAGKNPNPTRSTVRPVSEILHPPTGFTGPDLQLSPIQKAAKNLTATSIDISGSDFNALMPKMKELPFLAHLRQINTGHSTMDGMTGEGKFGVVIANRMPQPDKDYFLHLVSVEGWETRLPGGTVKVDDGDTCRLVSLASWKFTSGPDLGNFTNLIHHLDVDTLRLPYEEPTSWPETLTLAEKTVQDRYEDGYVPLNYLTRTGEKTFGWYRGPLVADIPQWITKLDPSAMKPIVTADEALVYDQETSLFDVSFAVAWQTGRLVTLANRPAAIAIYQWKKQSLQLLKLVQQYMAAAKSRGETPDYAMIRKVLQNPNHGHEQFTKYLAIDLGPRLSELHAEDGPVVPVREPSRLENHLDTMPGLLSRKQVLEMHEQGIDPHLYLAQKINSNE